MTRPLWRVVSPVSANPPLPGAQAAVRGPRIIGRYALYPSIATGGMASVHLGRLMGPVGFARTVAIKRLHEQYARDPEFVSMFLDEARVAARIRHPNVASVLDVVALDGELFLVMDYVQGESLSQLLRVMRETGEIIPPRITSSVVHSLLLGLHAAHEARGERGAPLTIVHRDVSPQNVIVGTDGVTRVVDFGIAKASGRVQITRDGQMKGKVRYMAPEQIMGHAVDRRADIFAASVVLWEALTGQRPYDGESDVTIMFKAVNAEFAAPSSIVPGLPPALDEVVAKGLARNPNDRYATAMEMADALEAAMLPATVREIGPWVERIAATVLTSRAELLAEVESASTEAEIRRRSSRPPVPPAQREEVETRVESVVGPRVPAHRSKAAVWGAAALGLVGVITLTTLFASRKDGASSAQPAAAPSAIPSATEPARKPEPEVAPAASAVSAASAQVPAPSSTPTATSDKKSRKTAPAQAPRRGRPGEGDYGF